MKFKRGAMIWTLVSFLNAILLHSLVATEAMLLAGGITAESDRRTALVLATAY